ncbi:MAG: hypothetical protein H6700_06830 [Myxococcales bacterium]|nr:hypothetical protein [Myxococcales bacterium]MCB9531462.1 hypothetical protein [Myxococcales bacterium]
MRPARSLQAAGRIVLVVAVLAGGSAVAACGVDAGSEPRPIDAPGGVSLGLFASDPEYDYTPMLREIAARGARDVMLVVPVPQRDASAATPLAAEVNVGALERALAAATRAGLRTAVMPIVTFQEPGVEWRGELMPAAGAAEWLDGYRPVVQRLAEAAEAGGAVRFVVGSELNSLQPHRAPWLAIIDEVRSAFSGRLTYSANWDSYETVTFWDALDEVGVSAYFPISGEGSARGRAARAWRLRWAELRAFGASWDRPVLLTEVGYPSHAAAAAAPWDETVDAVADAELQAALLGGFCDATPSASGFYVWNWFGTGGPRDTGHTLRGKPAAAVLRSCFATQ